MGKSMGRVGFFDTSAGIMVRYTGTIHAHRG
jgi:hypothetical protein